MCALHTYTQTHTYRAVNQIKTTHKLLYINSFSALEPAFLSPMLKITNEGNKNSITINERSVIAVYVLLGKIPDELYIAMKLSFTLPAEGVTTLYY